ncbi:MAG: hypothetical protein ABII71_04325 [Candidatus Micrarchaeota archaeon]
MNTKLMLLLVLGMSLVLFGCAKKAEPDTTLSPEGELGPAGEVPEAAPDAVPETPEPDAPPAEPENLTVPRGPGPVELPPSETDEEKLADLFQIDTDQPLEDEGLDIETPTDQE